MNNRDLHLRNPGLSLREIEKIRFNSSGILESVVSVLNESVDQLRII